MMEVSWQSLGEVFQQVFDLPAAERQACLDALCPHDPDLRAEVESLLRAHDLAEHFSRAGRDATVGPLSSAFTGAAPGRIFGPYTLLRQLGQGGMGTVFLAARADDEFDQLVAIKTLRIPGDEGYERFRAERQVHAGLEHPGIARLYGGGTSELGVPYIVMEYVDGGLPITAFCQEKKLGLEERLSLFLAVCEAVAHAHRNLVVHRDLKPSNILVTPRGEAKLLDFGISKRLAPEAADWDPTAGGPGPLTPAYASPEQLLGLAITTASDVFSLGVLLVELLAGQAPFARSLHERLRQLDAEADPPALDLRGLELGPLDRGRRHDLGAIALKALRRAPGERYGSVELLAADLRSCQGGRPVLARRPTPGYRLSRWLRRNWLVAGLSAACLLFLLISSIALAAQNRQVLRERDRVRAEAQKSERILALMLALFEGSDPVKARGADISVREVLVAAEPRIERELKGQPEVRAALFEAIGKVHLHLGSLDDAERLLGHARGLWQEQRAAAAFGSPAEDGEAAGARTFDLLAACARQRGAFAAALELLEQARLLRVAQFGPGSAEEGASLAQIADIELMLNRLPAAESTARRALALLEARPSAGTLEAKIAAQRTLGELIYRRAGRGPALPLFERALAEARRNLGAEHPATLGLLGKLADLKAEHPARFDLAESYIREKIASLDRLYQGGDHPDMAVSLDALGSILARKGDLDEAQLSFERSVLMRRRLMGEKSPFLAITLGNLGWFHLFRRGDPRTAEPLLRQALAMAEEFYPPGANLLTYPLIGIGRCRVLAGDAAGGEPFLRRALAIRLAGKPPASPEIPRAEMFLAEALAAQDRCREAAPLLDHARAVLLPAGEPDDLARMTAPWELFLAHCGQTDRNHEGPADPMAGKTLLASR